MEASLLVAYAAGVVTILSPCVLPILPIVLGSALDACRHGAAALAAGLVLAFTATGMAIATLSFSIGFSPDIISKIAAGIMMLLGIVMLSAPLQRQFALAAEHATQSWRQDVAAFSPRGLGGQFMLGLLLGAVWTPCVGPTLGAAIALAAQGQQLAYATSVMFVFALGIVTPLIVLTMGARATVARRKDMLRQLSAHAQPWMGGLLFLVGLAIVTEWMTHWEALALELMPQWLMSFVYQF
ncbi:MAG: cytochrome c biogenesis CcdA family protein [Hyphomicrobiaceae bacterium]